MLIEGYSPQLAQNWRCRCNGNEGATQFCCGVTKGWTGFVGVPWNECQRNAEYSPEVYIGCCKGVFGASGACW